MKYLPSPEQVQAGIAVANFLLTVTVALSGWFYFWPRFIKQKRIENMNQNSWQVLKLIDTAEEACVSLFCAFNLRKTDEEQYYLQKKAVASLKNLYTGLLVLQKTTFEIVNFLEEINGVLQAHRIRTAAIKDNQQCSCLTLTTMELLKNLNLIENLKQGPCASKQPNLVRFEKLRTLVASVAGLYQRDL